MADRYINGVEFYGQIFFIPQNQEQLHAFLGTLTFIGAFLGILNGIAKPLINKIAFPLRIITLNLFSIVIAMAMVWIADIIFPELEITGISALFWTTVITWGLGLLLIKWLPSEKK